MMPGEFSFSPLENGLDFLLSSLEHLTAASSGLLGTEAVSAEQRWHQKRHLKYAVLHLSASIELLLKVRLRQEHWSLVFSNPSKADRDAQDDGDFDSVSFHDLLERIVRICRVGLSDEHRRQLKNFRRRRNQLEHFGALGSLLAITSNVSEMVSFIVDFVEANFTPEQLEEQSSLIAEVRSRLGTCSAFVTQRWKEIQQDVDGFAAVIECPACLQRALEIDGCGGVKCRFCCHSDDSMNAASDYIARAERDDVVWRVMTCPECEHETLVRTSGARDSGYFCFFCGSSWMTTELVRCWECNELFVGDEKGDGNICDECFKGKIEKD